MNIKFFYVRHLITCLANELPVKGLALVSGVWKVVNTGNEVLGNIGGRKEAMGPQDYFTLHF